MSDPMCAFCLRQPPSMTVEHSYVSGTDQCGTTTEIRLPCCAPCGERELRSSTERVVAFHKQLAAGG